jgi:RimJ/RimL family protein N-acetyltransferase
MTAEPFWMKPKQIVLSDGTKVTLRPEIDSDLEPTWEMFSSFSDESMKYLPLGFTRERVEGWFKDIDYTKALPILGFVETENGTKMIASASLVFQKEEIYRHKAGFGISVHDDYQNKGLGNILTQYMLDIAAERGLKKVTLSVVAHNERAIHVYEKMGYIQEGRLRMDFWNPILEKWDDTILMGKILD